MFNKMIMPAEYRSEAQTRSDTERKIWRFYIFQIVFRTCVDFGFLSVQYNVYPYRFGFKKLFKKAIQKAVENEEYTSLRIFCETKRLNFITPKFP